MPFDPPKPAAKITADNRQQLLSEYFEHYSKMAKTNPSDLRRKLPRSVFQPFLDEIGAHVAKLAKEIAEGNVDESHGTAVKQFLEQNPVPGQIGKHLTMEMRAYALLVRAVLQWAVGQSLSIDRWVISGNARKFLRTSSPNCIVTGAPFGTDDIELHHPVRDGRPPLPVSKIGHKIADDVFDPQDTVGKLLVSVRRKRSNSWRLIWQGCVLESGEFLDLSEYAVGRSKSAAAAARWFARETELPVEEIRKWIEENELLEPTS